MDHISIQEPNEGHAVVKRAMKINSRMYIETFSIITMNCRFLAWTLEKPNDNDFSDPGADPEGGPGGPWPPPNCKISHGENLHLKDI